MNVCVLWLKTSQALGNRQVSFAIQLKVHWNIYNAKTMYTTLVTSMRRGVPAGSESYPWIPLICLHQWLRLAKGSFVLYLEEEELILIRLQLDTIKIYFQHKPRSKCTWYIFHQRPKAWIHRLQSITRTLVIIYPRQSPSDHNMSVVLLSSFIKG
jgi:hypothetical protein